MHTVHGMNRRRFLVASTAVLAAAPAFAAQEVIDVYKSPACGCCGKWIAHLRDNDFEVRAHDVDAVARSQLLQSVPRALGSCHTARVGGYLVEGHVPARDIFRLLKERPQAAGLTVPGMPRGSPGMESDVHDEYAVLLFQRDGSYTVFERYRARRDPGRST
ncbi:MAG: DUF411 domain-containing protein [Gammaproteobacteria bacterium]